MDGWMLPAFLHEDGWGDGCSVGTMASRLTSDSVSPPGADTSSASPPVEKEECLPSLPTEPTLSTSRVKGGNVLSSVRVLRQSGGQGEGHAFEKGWFGLFITPDSEARIKVSFEVDILADLILVARGEHKNNSLAAPPIAHTVRKLKQPAAAKRRLERDLKET